LLIDYPFPEFNALIVPEKQAPRQARAEDATRNSSLHPLSFLPYNFPMQYDLCLPWYYEYDADFVGFVKKACEAQAVTLWLITPENFLESINALYKGEITFRTLLDRAQGEPRFLPINRWAREHGARRLNPDEVAVRASDKATMHLELISGGVDTPYAVILSPFLEHPLLREIDLTPLGARFYMKPVMEGGGEGVVELLSADEIARTRLEFPEQKYLVQAHVEPMNLDGRPAWYRIFYAGGEVWPCWWNPSTHIYAILSGEEEAHYGLGRLREVTKRIASICGMDWFSTEIAVPAPGQFIAIDYVNDEIDLRLQSAAMDGVPDQVIEELAARLVKMAKP